MSSLASVLKTEACQKVEDGECLAQFHKKFWGKGMEDEKAEWLRVTRSEEGCEDEVIDDGGMIIEVDDDIIPGCYVLDISIDGIVPSHIWVRADYVRIYNFCQKFYDDNTKPFDMTPSLVITGQPGIGKTLWIYYATHRCAAEKKPFIWLFQKKYCLFVEEGVYLLPQDFDHGDIHPIVWTFVDSDESPEGVPEITMVHNTRLFVIYVTSPVRCRFSRMNKTTTNLILTMNSWGRQEIMRVAYLLPSQPGVNVNEVFDHFGPVPQICILSSALELLKYENAVDEAISDITVKKIKKMNEEASDLSMDAISHKLFLVSRKDRDDVNSERILSPITSSIRSRLATRFRDLPQEELLDLYKYFERYPGSRLFAGMVYESRVQSHLAHGISLELLPMVTLPYKLEAQKKELETQPQWHSSQMPLRTKKLETLRKGVLDQQISIAIQPASIEEYTDNELHSIEPGVLYIPISHNQMALDSFILQDGYLYIFQITIAAKHDINRGLIDVANQYGFPSQDNWRLVFIMPSNRFLTVPRPRNVSLQKLAVYSAVVD